jgi:hypothetical protein
MPTMLSRLEEFQEGERNHPIGAYSPFSDSQWRYLTVGAFAKTVANGNQRPGRLDGRREDVCG